MLLRKAVSAVGVFSLYASVQAGPHRAGLDPNAARRQLPASTVALTTNSATTISTYTFITPSPSASPIAITRQSQVVTTYVPVMTMCAMSSTALNLAPKYGNSTSLYDNYTNGVASSLNEGCTTYYNTTSTTVCATVLTGIATSYDVTSCNQAITFSTAYGYYQSYDSRANTSAVLAPIETRTSYWVAPWQALTAGLTPQNVTQKVCSYPVATATTSQQCVDTYESWATFTVTSLTSTTSHVDLTTTISGPSQIIIETFHADVTEQITVFSLSTMMVLEYSTESVATSTSTFTREDVTTSTEPTVSSTITVEVLKTP